MHRIVTAQPQTTIQSLISHVTHCRWYSVHKQFPCIFLGQISPLFWRSVSFFTWHYLFLLRMYVSAIEKHFPIAHTYIGYVQREKHFNHYWYHFHQLQLQSLSLGGWRMSGLPLSRGPWAFYQRDADLAYLQDILVTFWKPAWRITSDSHFNDIHTGVKISMR